MKDIFDELISIKDACELYKKGESTLRLNIKNKKFVVGTDCKKFGTTWVFKKTALEREYGNVDIKKEGSN
ncbi:helix-turn-helix domain-containing protein [Clostridioides sp. ES-S-0010-02]|uniref:helix-turn-helix domain-containing protein n=1 Tax=Clostridioides sp. ES-S-0010-02 TaxID=2770776 RepID=UPI001D0F4C2F|nr:hypothetical protein JJC01_10510 [Clostridioides sp. ES-S-0010-02]